MSSKERDELIESIEILEQSIKKITRIKPFIYFCVGFTIFTIILNILEMTGVIE